MRRLHLFEIEDQWWCPRPIRDAATDYLAFAEGLSDPYGPAVPLLTRALERTGADRIIDLGSGAGGSWPTLARALEQAGRPVEVWLTDKYPNLPALERARAASGGRLRIYPRPVDATRVPGDLPGFRTLFSSFHHFRPRQARAILADAVEQKQGIAVFEVVQRHPKAIALVLTVPPTVLAVTPFIRPYRWSRLLWTYLIPAVPAVALFDGLVSCMRAYTPDELLRLTEGLSDAGYEWEAGQVRVRKSPLPLTYLIGYPKRPSP
jgi:hypothetical protein